MYKKIIFYTGIILFPFFWNQKATAQQNRERHRSVTITQTVVDGKVVSADTLITYTDTTTRTVNSKEVSMEMPYTKGSTVYIDNAYRKLNIRQSKDGKVRLTTTAFYYGEPAFTNEQWLEKLNIRMKKADSGIVISSGGINTGSSSGSWSGSAYSYYVPDPPTPPAALTVTGQGSTQSNGSTITQYGTQKQVTVNGYSSANRPGPATTWGRSSNINSTAVFDEKGNISYNSSSLRRELTLYIPADANLDITSKYADVSVDHDVSNIKANINNASLDILNATDANIHSIYGTVSTGNLTNADITSTSGKVFVKDVARLQLNTRYTKVEAENCGWLKTHSISDDYDIDEVKNFEGEKTYGSLRLDKLTGSLNIKGSSADVKIRTIDPSVTNITIDNKYSDIRLPVANLKNYEVLFSGNYSSVFAPFERRDTTIENDSKRTTTIRTATGFGTETLYSNGSGRNNKAFTAAVGDVKGTHTKFNLTCTSCNVDFK